MYPGYTLLWWPWVYIAGAFLYHYTLWSLDTLVMMTKGIHCWCLSISLLYLMVPRYTLLWWPWVYISGAYLYHYYSLCTLDTHCYDDPGYTLLALIYITILDYIPWIHIVIMTLSIHCWTFLFHYYTLCTLETHCYDDPGYTLLVLIYITIIPYVPWIHIVMMTLGIHCWCFSVSLLYLMYPRYTLLWWPWVYISGAYLYHYYSLCTLDTHCYDDPGYTLLVLFYITIIPYVLWIHIVLNTLGIHFWGLSISLLYIMYPGYTLLW